MLATHRPSMLGHLRGRSTALLGLAVLAALTALPVQRAAADHQPADKVAVSASTLQSADVNLKVAGATSQTVTLLTGKLKTSSPTDLLIQFTAECALQTDVKTTGNTSSTAYAAQRVWVEIDGRPVAVSNMAGDNGKVTLCDREFTLTTSEFDDLDASIAIYQKTKQANGFNWVALNVGSGAHTIEVKTDVEATVAGSGEARAYVGKRTLVVEPAKLSNDASF